MAFFCFQEGGDVGRADLEFECRSDAVHGFDALAVEILGVLVEIDESRGDDQSGGMDDAAATERPGGNAGDFAVENADIADGVEAGFGVHDAAAGKDQVVLLGGRGGEGQGQEDEGEDGLAHAVGRPEER